jgi:hypothetical protein
MKDKQKVNHRAGRRSCNFWGTGEIATAKHTETSRRTLIFAALAGSELAALELAASELAASELAASELVGLELVGLELAASELAGN